MLVPKRSLPFIWGEMTQARITQDILDHWFSTRATLPPGDIWHCLEIFLVVTTRGDMTGI